MQTLTELRSKVGANGRGLRRTNIVCVGLGVLNHIGVRSDWNDTSRRGHLRYFFVEGGGMAHSAAVAASHLGAKAAVLSVFSTDDVGKRIAKDLKRHGVHIGNCAWDTNGVSGVALITVDGATGESKQLIRAPFHRKKALDALDLEPMRSADAVVIDNSSSQLFRNACRFLKRVPASDRPPVVLDTDRVDLLVDCPPGAVIVLPIYSLGRGPHSHSLARSARELVLATRATAVIITCGETGGIVAFEREVSSYSVPKVSVVDTTGAGDVFHGVLATFLGAATPIIDAVIGAAAAATLKCTDANGRRGFPSPSQVLEFLSGQTHAFRLRTLRDH